MELSIGTINRHLKFKKYFYIRMKVNKIKKKKELGLF